MRNMDELIDFAQDEIGRDAYVMFPESRRLIPDDVLWGFASACLLEFVKPLINFKGLGKETHEFLADFLKSWQSKDSFEDYVKAEELRSALERAFEALPETIPNKAATDATSKLESALIDLGMRATDAHRHAAALAKAAIGHSA